MLWTGDRREKVYLQTACRTEVGPKDTKLAKMHVKLVRVSLITEQTTKTV